ncbi:hypothetical protein [Ensifer sp. ZNC0028]|uniref:hypothetical protein n=1 Tax=unclassified Ensifer TaxID=2633371 RepID=UPI000A59F16B|nr:hypothetical protein [Ensifer sp. ZNC0028]
MVKKILQRVEGGQFRNQPIDRRSAASEDLDYRTFLDPPKILNRCILLVIAADHMFVVPHGADDVRREFRRRHQADCVGDYWEERVTLGVTQTLRR